MIEIYTKYGFSICSYLGAKNGLFPVKVHVLECKRLRYSSFFTFEHNKKVIFNFVYFSNKIIPFRVVCWWYNKKGRYLSECGDFFVKKRKQHSFVIFFSPIPRLDLDKINYKIILHPPKNTNN